jgi:membrane-associated phospholipid phosphatase
VKRHNSLFSFLSTFQSYYQCLISSKHLFDKLYRVKIKRTIYALRGVLVDIFKSLGPFLFILLVFGSFRFITPELSERVHYTLMPGFDKLLFNGLPTITLQRLLWHGYVTWYDYILYGVYVSHYILPIILAFSVYKHYKSEYLRLAMTYIIASFTAFIIFIAYPTAPPWLASEKGYIPHITRISVAIFSSLGVHNFSKLYSTYAPNPIAAAPSLHTTYSVLFVLFIYRLFGKRWGTISLIYPFCIILGVVYMGEHYAFDIFAGILLAVASYLVTPIALRYMEASIYKFAIKVPFTTIVSNKSNNSNE